MAYLLRKWKDNTIKSRMYQYLFLVIGAAVLINAATMLFFQINMGRYEKTMEQVLELNHFYIDLEEGNSFLGNYMKSGTPEIYQSMEAALEEADYLLAALEEGGISQGFVRDIQDMRRMLGTYLEAARAIQEQLFRTDETGFTSGMLETVLELYDEAQEVYALMDGEFKNLHLSLLDYANTRMAVLNWQKKFFLAEWVGAILLMIFWSILRGRKLTEQIVSPIQALTEKAVEIRDGSMAEFTEAHIQEAGSRELQILIHVFNMMIDQIQKQFRATEEAAAAKARLHQQELENLKITNLLRTSELRALQMQMNPHFLFNTLNMIAKTAYLGDSEETVFLLQKTAQLLRYSLDYMGKSVTLARELEILDCYVCLQEKRFAERIDFDFDLDERFHQVLVPCLILQPLVENSITHGVGMYTSGARILIRTRYLEEERRGMISVVDNGLGMEPQQLARVRENLDTMEIGGASCEQIGLENVYMRLKNFFEGDAQMELYSVPNQETEIRILIPAKERGE